MKILIQNHYAGYPEIGMEYRPYYLARKWREMGHEVLIAGATFSHLRDEYIREGEDLIDEIEYLWIKTNEYESNGIKRLFSMFAFVKGLYKQRGYFMGFKPDVVVASSTYPLDIYPARRIAKDNNAALVFEIHDLWPLSPMQLGGMSKYHPFIVLMQKAENDAYKYCDKCISILPCVQQHVQEHGLDLKKLELVPNGIVEEDWAKPGPIPQEHEKLFTSLRERNQFIVCFSGSHGRANALENIINATAELKQENVSLVLVGSGMEKQKIMQEVVDKGISNVFFLSPVEKLAIPTLLSKADVLYIGLKKEPLFKFGISPNKLFDYMMASRPVLQAIEAGNDIISEARCGITVEPDNVKAAIKAIIELKNMSQEERQQMGENGKKYVLSNHTYQVLAEKYLSAMQEAVKIKEERSSNRK